MYYLVIRHGDSIVQIRTYSKYLDLYGDMNTINFSIYTCNSIHVPDDEERKQFAVFYEGEHGLTAKGFRTIEDAEKFVSANNKGIIRKVNPKTGIASLDIGSKYCHWDEATGYTETPF